MWVRNITTLDVKEIKRKVLNLSSASTYFTWAANCSTYFFPIIYEFRAHAWFISDKDSHILGFLTQIEVAVRHYSGWGLAGVVSFHCINWSLSDPITDLNLHHNILCFHKIWANSTVHAWSICKVIINLNYKYIFKLFHFRLLTPYLMYTTIVGLGEYKGEDSPRSIKVRIILISNITQFYIISL
jgi:hypothetical protein